MKKRRQLSLQSQMTVLFLTLIIGIGGAIAYKSYQSSRQLVIDNAVSIVDLAADRFSLAIERTYHPIGMVLEMFSTTRADSADTLEERLNRVPLMARILDTETHVRALLVGQDNGEYFSVGRFQTLSHREALSAPMQAHYYVTDNRRTTAGSMRTSVYFYDQQLQLLEESTTENTDYDPRTRPWYQLAQEKGEQTVLTSPYLYATEAVLGITMARQARDGNSVFAADITLREASEELNQQKVTPQTELLLFEANGQLIAHSEEAKLYRRTPDNKLVTRHIHDFKEGPLSALPNTTVSLSKRELTFRYNDKHWMALYRVVGQAAEHQRGLLVLVPMEQLLADAMAALQHTLLIAALALILAMPLTWWGARTLARPLESLVKETRRIVHFDFSKPIDTPTRIKEISRLGASIERMRSTIQRFLSLISSLANEERFEDLLQKVEAETRDVSGATVSRLWVLDETGKKLIPAEHFRSGSGPVAEETNAGQLDLEGDPNNPLCRCLQHNKPTLHQWEIDSPELPPQLADLLNPLPHDSLRCVLIPLTSRADEHIGLLTLVFPPNGKDNHDLLERLNFVEALSGFAAVSIESRDLIRMQQRLLDSFIQLLAGAIDAKSPYTGGHCQRVPELTNLLAQAACDSQRGPYANFQLDEREWEAVRIAGWMHDCGKVTSPEYVIDKATKLETLYDRIHEVRMRFEVLKRDAEVQYWREKAGPEQCQASQQALQATWDTLDKEFQFVAECNLGGEYLETADQEKLRRIGDRRWQKTLSDRIGISWEEAQRKHQKPEGALPVEERLLDDKPEHRIQRPQADELAADNPWGFRLTPPEVKYNRGELHNLSVQRGTLTDEERYMVNDHIVQTIIMLEKLPFPRHLRQVPALAGGHHEKMDGTGYPKGLKGANMPPVARMMAIADIFEALTAADRPYKRAKTLSESLNIMVKMCHEQHIDSELFRLFLETEVYMKYARRFLNPEQIDFPDKQGLLEKLAAPLNSGQTH